MNSFVYGSAQRMCCTAEGAMCSVLFVFALKEVAIGRESDVSNQPNVPSSLHGHGKYTTAVRVVLRADRLRQGNPYTAVSDSDQCSGDKQPPIQQPLVLLVDCCMDIMLWCIDCFLRLCIGSSMTRDYEQANAHANGQLQQV